MTSDTSRRFDWLSLEGHELNLAAVDAMDPPAWYGNRNTIVASRQFVDKHVQCGGHLSPAHTVPLWQQYYCEPISTGGGKKKRKKCLKIDLKYVVSGLGEKGRLI